MLWWLLESDKMDLSLVTPTAALPLYLFIQGSVPPAPPQALHSEGVDQHLCSQLTQLKGQRGAAVGALWGRTTAMTDLSDLQRLSVKRQQIPGVSVHWPRSSNSFLDIHMLTNMLCCSLMIQLTNTPSPLLLTRGRAVWQTSRRIEKLARVSARTCNKR